VVATPPDSAARSVVDGQLAAGDGRGDRHAAGARGQQVAAIVDGLVHEGVELRDHRGEVSREDRLLRRGVRGVGRLDDLFLDVAEQIRNRGRAGNGDGDNAAAGAQRLLDGFESLEVAAQALGDREIRPVVLGADNAQAGGDAILRLVEADVGRSQVSERNKRTDVGVNRTHGVLLILGFAQAFWLDRRSIHSECPVRMLAILPGKSDLSIFARWIILVNALFFPQILSVAAAGPGTAGLTV
jgi:hypothetical protein